MPPQKVALMEVPFSRSYGGNLPSSFNIVLSSALVCSTCPPVLVWECGLNDGAISWNNFAAHNPISMYNLHPPSLPSGRGICSCSHRLRLSPSCRGRLTLRGLALREPLGLRRECFSHSLSLSCAFSLLIPPLFLRSSFTNTGQHLA